MFFSVIIPVYNRPNELRELLTSLNNQTEKQCFEIIIVEDGSSLSSKSVINEFEYLTIKYYYKSNSGPGDSRNFGMRQAIGDYFLLFDSDCILPTNYFETLLLNLKRENIDFFGGSDTEDKSFSDVQKAINFVMTSRLTTAKIRGNDSKKFQPRSFNMGLTRECFLASKGFRNIHPGEDPDLVFRLWDLGFYSTYFDNITVVHKRRINFRKFYMQINKFAKARVVLDKWHPKYQNLLFWFPTLFIAGLFFSILLSFTGLFIFLIFYVLYFIYIFYISYIKYRNLNISRYVLIALLIQLYAYGSGYLYGKLMINFLKKKPEKIFSNLFF